MLRPRIIPCLLVHEGGLVKTVKFKDPRYVGDPINAVKIFNEKACDELVVLDIDASANGAEPDYQMIARLAAECRMPLCYGGGVTSADQADRIIGLGVEKVSLSASALGNPALVTQTANRIGQQSVVVVLDVRNKTGLFRKGYEAVTHNAKRAVAGDVFDLAEQMQNAGAGEIVINSVDLDGTYAGYDLTLARDMQKRLHVPVTILGGAASLADIEKLIETCGLVGACAGSMFVFKGGLKAVLINYPTPEQKDELCARALAAGQHLQLIKPGAA